MKAFYKSDKVRFLSGLIFIIIIYSWFFLFFMEQNKNVYPRKIRHLITLITTIVVYLIGTFHLGKLKDSWMSSLWHLVHISGLCILTMLGLFNWLIMEISVSVKLFALSIQELLISPMLYVAMGLLNRTLYKNKVT